MLYTYVQGFNVMFLGKIFWDLNQPSVVSSTTVTDGEEPDRLHSNYSSALFPYRFWTKHISSLLTFFKFYRENNVT